MGNVAQTRGLNMRLIGLFILTTALSQPLFAQPEPVVFQVGSGQLRHAVYVLWVEDPPILKADFPPPLPFGVLRVPVSHLRIYRQGEQMRISPSAGYRLRPQYNFQRT